MTPRSRQERNRTQVRFNCNLSNLPGFRSFFVGRLMLTVKIAEATEAKMAPVLLSTTLSDIVTANMKCERRSAAVCSRCCSAILSHIRAANANVPPCYTRQDQTGSVRLVSPCAYLPCFYLGLSHLHLNASSNSSQLSDFHGHPNRNSD